MQALVWRLKTLEAILLPVLAGKTGGMCQALRTARLSGVLDMHVFWLICLCCLVDGTSSGAVVNPRSPWPDKEESNCSECQYCI